MATTVIVQFNFSEIVIRTRYTPAGFEANNHLLSYLAQSGVVTLIEDVGQEDVVDTTSDVEHDIFHR